MPLGERNRNITPGLGRRDPIPSKDTKIPPSPPIRPYPKGKTFIPPLVQIFMPPMQQEVVKENLRGEEANYFRDILETLERIINEMPKTYTTEGIKEEDKIIYLHYFYADSDWYVAEKEIHGDEAMAFGYAILHGDTEMAEWGYVSINEIKETGKVELDFHWKPRPFKEVMEERGIRRGSPGNPGPLKLGNPKYEITYFDPESKEGKEKTWTFDDIKKAEEWRDELSVTWRVTPSAIRIQEKGKALVFYTPKLPEWIYKEIGQGEWIRILKRVLSQSELGENFYVSTFADSAKAEKLAKALSEIGINAKAVFMRGILGSDPRREYGIFVENFTDQNHKMVEALLKSGGG